MKIEEGDVTVDESRSNLMATVWVHKKCPINKECFIVSNFGTPIRMCEHLNQISKEELECVHPNKGTTLVKISKED